MGLTLLLCGRLISRRRLLVFLQLTKSGLFLMVVSVVCFPLFLRWAIKFSSMNMVSQRGDEGYISYMYTGHAVQFYNPPWLYLIYQILIWCRNMRVILQGQWLILHAMLMVLRFWQLVAWQFIRRFVSYSRTYDYSSLFCCNLELIEP